MMTLSPCGAQLLANDSLPLRTWKKQIELSLIPDILDTSMTLTLRHINIFYSVAHPPSPPAMVMVCTPPPVDRWGRCGGVFDG